MSGNGIGANNIILAIQFQVKKYFENEKKHIILLDVCTTDHGDNTLVNRCPGCPYRYSTIIDRPTIH